MRLGIPRLLAAFIASCLPLSQALAGAVVIYDNTVPGDHGITTTTNSQIGNEVTAAPGTPRAVTELDIGLTSQGSPVTANLQAFLYANNGAGGSPGTLLWQSALMSGVAVDSTNLLYAFAVPDVIVPDTFTWTLSIAGQSGTLGLVPAGAASVGTTGTPWVGSPGSFESLPSLFDTEARVSALASTVPEPATLVLVPLGLVGLLAGRRRRNLDLQDRGVHGS